MRLYKVTIVVMLALGLGLLAGYLWWEGENARLARELSLAKQSARSAGDRVWIAKGILRGLAAQGKLIVITHEDIPGLMSGMTMGFPPQDPKLLQGLAPGDVVQFTLKQTDNQLVLVAISKDSVR